MGGIGTASRRPRARRRYRLTPHARRALAAAAVSVALCLAMAEAASRIFVREPLGLFRESPVYGYEMVPGFSGGHGKFSEFRTSIRTNSRGLRDAELTAGSAGHRVLALGDSVTFGWGVEAEDAYPDQLESLLRGGRRPGAAVINAGVWGYNTIQEIAFLERNGTYYAPQVVLVGFTSTVTLTRNWYSSQLGVPTVEPLRPSGAGLAGTIHRVLKDTSNAYSFLERRWSYRRTILPSLGDLRRLFGTAAPAGEPAASAPGTPVTAPAAPRWPETLPDNVPADAGVAESVRLLGTLRDRSDRAGASMVVVVFPTVYELVEAANTTTAESRSLAATRALISALDAAGIAAVDLAVGLLPHMKNGEELFLPHDPVHLNRLGHRRTAEALASELARRWR